MAYSLTKKDDGVKRPIIFMLALSRYLVPVAINYAKTNHLMGKEENTTCSESCFLGAKAAFTIVFYLISQ